jgi:cobalamin-dependent methionine synthase I
VIIVGELINSSRKAIKAVIERQDVSSIQKIAIDQLEAGAHYIDVNAGVFVEKELTLARLGFFDYTSVDSVFEMLPDYADDKYLV